VLRIRFPLIGLYAIIFDSYSPSVCPSLPALQHKTSSPEEEIPVEIGPFFTAVPGRLADTCGTAPNVKTSEWHPT